MTQAEFNEYRRSFLQHGIRGLGAVSLLGFVPVRGSLVAGEMPKVGEDDPVAVSLNYVQDVTAAKAGSLPPRAGEYHRCSETLQ